MTDYWLSKLFYDLHNDPTLAAEYRTGMAEVLGRYELAPAVRKAVLEDDVAAIAPLVNPYLLRFYFQVRGMPRREATLEACRLRRVLLYERCGLCIQGRNKTPRMFLSANSAVSAFSAFNVRDKAPKLFVSSDSAVSAFNIVNSIS